MNRTALQAELQRLATLDVGRCTFAAPLAEHCTWRIGGPADLLIEPTSIAQVQAVIYFARRHAIPLLVIGQGSNLLFADAGLRGIVLRLGANFAHVTIDGATIVAEAGAWVPGLARRAQQAGLAGLEHTIGIPGTIGGLVVMNGGSQRRGIGENVRRVWTVGEKGALTELTAEQCRFGYRCSALQESGAVVVKVELACESGDPKEIRRAMLADLRERRRKFPRKEPNCGSVFLSTAQMHASVGPPGKIIEEAGLKGARVGAAEVSRRHANFIVNTGGATAADVLALIDHVRRTVHARIGFVLGCEVRYVDEQGVVQPADQLLPKLP
jgi:UDP-N-acetylmuramate dehydrogenase